MTPSLMSTPSYPDPGAESARTAYIAQPTLTTEPLSGATAELRAAPPEEPTPPLLPSATKTEQFLLTAADQESGSRDERLNRVIRSKYEAGLLKPYDYVKGYARLSRWMDRKYAVISFPPARHLTLNLAFRGSRSNKYCNRYQFFDPSSE